MSFYYFLTAQPLKKIKYLRIEFEGPMHAFEIPAFRGAVVNKVGRAFDYFHNHKKDAGYFYRYPLIQYKVLHERPTLLCIEIGTEEIHRFFQNREWNIHISGRELPMKIARLDMKQYTLQAWDRRFAYRIRNWVALTPPAYQEYQKLEALQEKLIYLEKKLIGNILSFAKGVDWYVERPIDLKITHYNEPRWVKLKNQKMLGFNLDFVSNVFLPGFIGLGKSVSLGFGTLLPRKLNQN